MNWLQFKKELIRRSGRADLVVNTTNYVNNGIELYANSAQKWLDDNGWSPKPRASYLKSLVTGDSVISLKYARAIDEVYTGDADSIRQLAPVTWEWVLKNFQEPISSLTNSEPLYWAI